MQKKRVKVTLKIKKKRSLLDYLDNFLETERSRTGAYPARITLAPNAIKRMYQEIKELGIENCWADKPNNYRGIRVVPLKKRR